MISNVFTGGDVCSIIEEGYKHEEDGRNDMKKSNRMTNVVCVVVGLLLVLFIIGSVKDLVFGPETPTDAASSTSAKSQDEIKKNITASVYVPSSFDKNANAPFYVVLQNKGNHHFEGSFELSNLQTPRASDRMGYAKLDPHEVKVIPCAGTAPSDGKVDVKLDGSFSDDAFTIDSGLEYAIVKMDGAGGKGGRTFLNIYVPPKQSDDTYLAISKELKENYGKKSTLLEARFAPVMIQPTKDDAIVIFTKNDQMKFSHVVFYSDATNTNIVEMDRKKANI